MNDEEREEFWEALLNAKYEYDIVNIKSKIKYPNKLYRYRTVNIRNLNALSSNENYFSTPSHYDDPFDTFIRIDKQSILQKLQTFEKDHHKIYEWSSSINLEIPNEIRSEILANQILKNLHDVRNKIRETLWSICFTENYNNETLWLKYAQNHEGFVLEYDIKNFFTYLPFIIEKSNKMISDNLFFTLYPIYYSNKVRDETDFATFCSILHSFETVNAYEIIDKILHSGIYRWETERTILIKKWIHHYDEEWRLILGNEHRIGKDLKPRIICKPSKIILGLKMSDDNKKAVLMAAEKAGINEIEKMIIDDNDEFVAEKLKI